MAERNAYSTSAAASTATASTATATTAGGRAATVLGAVGALGSAAGTLGMLLRSAGELDRDLALENGLAIQLLDGALGLRGRRQSHEGVANGAVGARVGGDGDGLAGQC